MGGTLVSVLVLSAALGAGSSSAPIRLGIDAADLSSTFKFTSPKIDPALLPYAPTSPDVALASSLATVGTGMALVTASSIELLFASGFGTLVPAQVRFIPFYAGFGVGMLMMDFGPCMGDLLNGDLRHFLVNGTLKAVGSVLLAFLGPYGAMFYLGWIALDVWNARNAPARWVERTFGEGAKAAPRETFVPPQPLGEFGGARVLAFEF